MNDRLNRLILNLPVRYDSVYIRNAGMFLPGPPIDNESIDQYIAPLNRSSERIKRQVLRDNGIKTRHYAISETGETLYSSCDLATKAVRDCLDGSDVDLHEIPCCALAPLVETSECLGSPICCRAS